jgi:polyhydroxyalkanoate synthesis regulator phasin
MKKRAIALALLIGALIATNASAQDGSDDDVSLRAELQVLKKEVRDLRARVSRLEAQLATVAPAASDTVTKPDLTAELGFVFPGMPRGASYGAESPSELARFVHHAATTREHELDALIAFQKGDFLVPEELWKRAGGGSLKTVAGLPTRDELELALGAMKELGPASRLLGILPVPEAAPRSGEPYIRVVDLDVRAEGRSDRYRLTAVRIGGRWLVAHLLAVGAEEDARAFVEDLVASEKSFRAFRQTRYAQSLSELVGVRKEIEKRAENFKSAGLTFPIAGRLDRLDRDRIEWSSSGEELRGPFYRYKISGDDSGGWSAVATPRSPSYRSFFVSVPGSASVRDPVVVRQARGGNADEHSEPANTDQRREQKRREAEPEGE